MPQPTREQFDAAAKSVMETAPAGLSREQFFALIDQQLAGTPKHSAETVYDDPALAQKEKLASGEIPSSFGEGFLRSIKDQAKAAITGNSGLEHAAHPETPGDFLSLLLPQGVNRSAQLAKEVEESGRASARGAGSGLLNRVRGFWKGVGQDINTPTQTLGSGPHPSVLDEDKRLMGLAPEEAAPAATITPNTGRDFYDTYKSNGAQPTGGRRAAPTPKPPPAPPAPKPEPISVGGQTINPTDALYQRLRGMTGGGAATPPAAPNATDMLADALSERGLDPRISNVPPGPTAPLNVADLYPKEATHPIVDEVSSKMLPSDRRIANTPRQDELMSKLGGQQTTTDPIAQELMGGRRATDQAVNMSTADWQELRRYYGSEKLAQMTGKTVEEIKQLAPGPSHTPLAVEDSINQNPDGIFKWLPK